MNANSCRFLKMTVCAATVLTGLMVASCAPLTSSPEQVQTKNPSVTYKYNSDQELVQANENAATYCNKYQSVPRTASFSNDPDGSRVVIFECVQTAGAPSTQYNPNLTYNYRTDQELLNAAQNAQIYCLNNGSHQLFSDMVTNSNGTKTVTFHCSAG